MLDVINRVFHRRLFRLHYLFRRLFRRLPLRRLFDHHNCIRRRLNLKTLRFFFCTKSLILTVRSFINI